jgi:hypothetical protein
MAGIFRLTINFAAVSNPENSYDSPRIINFIHGAVTADANSPVVVWNRLIVAAGWAWIVCKRSDARNDTVEKRSWQGF